MAEWRARGFVPQFCWYHMVAALSEPLPIPPTGCSATLRELRVGEEFDMVQMVNRSFGRERLKVGCIKKWKQEYVDFDENWIHVADVDGKIASITVSLPDRRYNEHFGEKRGYLGPAATLPEFRCKNLGTALNAKAMNFLLAKGYDSVALYTDSLNVASNKLLRKLNFKICHIWTQMIKHLKTSPNVAG
jgi:ribosomal protein S18 acetylase RimI-like enzyme